MRRVGLNRGTSGKGGESGGLPVKQRILCPARISGEESSLCSERKPDYFE